MDSGRKYRTRRFSAYFSSVLISCVLLCSCIQRHESENFSYAQSYEKARITQQTKANSQTYSNKNFIIQPREMQNPAKVKSEYNYTSPVARKAIPLPQKEPENLPQETQQ
jgi:hypothetical protein